MNDTIYVTAVQLLYVPLNVGSPGAAIDPKVDTVRFIFPGEGDAVDLSTASWTPGDFAADGIKVFGTCLVGAGVEGGDIRLEVGKYRPYAQIVHGKETIPLKSPTTIRVATS